MADLNQFDFDFGCATNKVRIRRMEEMQLPVQEGKVVALDYNINSGKVVPFGSTQEYEFEFWRCRRVIAIGSLVAFGSKKRRLRPVPKLDTPVVFQLGKDRQGRTRVQKLALLSEWREVEKIIRSAGAA